MDRYRARRTEASRSWSSTERYQLCTKQQSVSVSDPRGQAAEEARPDGRGDGDALDHCLQAADHEAGD